MTKKIQGYLNDEKTNSTLVILVFKKNYGVFKPEAWTIIVAMIVDLAKKDVKKHWAVFILYSPRQITYITV